MSSPVAHTSLILLLWPGLRARFQNDISRPRRVLLAIAVLAALMGPDFDLVIGLFVDAPLATYHNGGTHSFVGILAGGIVFAVIARMIVPLPMGPLLVVGTLAIASHILIDFFTYGRGLQLLWPLSQERIEAPFVLFRGVRHSSDVTIGTHLLNLLSDVLFAFAVWIVSGWVRHRHTANPPLPIDETGQSG